MPPLKLEVYRHRGREVELPYKLPFFAFKEPALPPVLYGPQVGDFRLNKDPLLQDLKSLPHSNPLSHPNMEPPTTSPGAWLQGTLRQGREHQAKAPAFPSREGSQELAQPATVSLRPTLNQEFQNRREGRKQR